jgi:hypothetical protein
MLWKCERFGLRVAHPLDDRQPAAFQQPGGVSQRGVQSHVVVDLEQLPGGQAQVLAVPGVALIPVGDDGVDAVVAPVELDDHQDAAVALGPGGAGRLREEAGDGRGQGQQGGRVQEVAAGKHGNTSSGEEE